MKEKLSAELDRFKAVLDIYGSHRQAWPAPDREMMTRLLETSDVAKSLLRQEEKFDSLMDREDMSPAAPAALLSRVLTDAEELNTGSIARVLWPFGSFWQPASGLLVAGFVGAFLGLASPNLISGEEDLALDEPSFGVSLFDLESDNASL